MEKKTISINPKLFEVSKNGKSKKSEKKKPKGVVKPNTLKKQLIQRIKSHKKEHSTQHEKSHSETTNKDGNEHTKKIETEDNDFDSAMKDLSDIVKNVKDHKKTLKKAKMPTTGLPPMLQQHQGNVSIQQQSYTPEVKITLPETLSNVSSEPVAVSQKNVAPAWGCLKGGNKPTYKTWKNNNRHMSTKTASKITIVDTEPMRNNDNVGSFTYREKRLQEIRNKTKMRENSKPITKSSSPSKKLKKTVKNVYTLGKKGKSIKVLIKNNKTRKNNQIEKNIIEQTDPKDMKIYLKNQGLISAGSSAPMDVMREIFVSSKLSGDIENKNSDVLLNNYLSTDS